MPWSDKLSFGTQKTTATTTRVVFENSLVLNPGESVWVQIEASWSDSPVDPLDVFVMTSLDGVTWDNVPTQNIKMTQLIDPQVLSFPVTGPYQFRIEVASSGSTDTITVDAFYRRDNVNFA